MTLLCNVKIDLIMFEPDSMLPLALAPTARARTLLLVPEPPGETFTT